MGLRAFCSEGYADPWQLGRRAALGLSAVVIGLVLVSVAFALASLLHVIGKVTQPHPVAMARPLFELCAFLFTAFGVGSYTYVASQALRPHILHVYGLLLVLHLVQSSLRPLPFALEQMEEYLAFSLVLPLLYVLRAFRWALFCKVVTEKLGVLGPPSRRCTDVKLWGKGLAASLIFSALGGGAAWTLVASNLIRGVPWEEIFATMSFFPRLADDCKVSVADKIAFSIIVNFVGLASGLLLVCSSVYIVTAWRLIRGVITALEVRGTPVELLTKVRNTLRKHMLGILLSLSTTMLAILAAIVNSLNLVGQDDDEELMSSAVNALDTMADVAGILFLSDIGTLLLCEDPKAGDINRKIRSLLQAAVLGGRAVFAFEGQVIATPSRRCIVSFPGKFTEEWKDMTWQSERHEASTACVFLPESDPHGRFGKHSLCPETPGACWCMSLYGVQKPWGCRWFQVWEANVQRAVELGLQLVVVFFPGQAGQGLVEWDSLVSVNLWDGCGLGGSQKGEAAYLQRQGIRFTAEDLDAVRSWLDSTRGRGGR